MGFKRNIQGVINGEPVAAGVVNRAVQDIHNNTEYLYDLIRQTRSGEALVAFERTVDEDLAVGMPVFLNAGTGSFSKALAVADVSVNGQITTGASCAVWGIVLRKHGPTSADILIDGYASVDLTAALAAGDSPIAGTYWLSSAVPGQLTRDRPSIPAMVLRCDGAGHVRMLIRPVDVLLDHIHHAIRLFSIPAGDHSDPGVGNTHSISNPDPGLPGWLPANHASFDGTAPADAKFGYNLAAHPTLKSLWPPVPVQHCRLLLDGVVMPSGEEGGIVQFTPDGIWWMSNCYDDVPFPPDYDTGNPPTPVDPNDCPFVYASHNAIIEFTELGYLTDASVVTSLKSDDERLRVRCASDPDATASSGDLRLSLNLDFGAQGQTNPDSLAFKAYNQETQKFERGPVLTGIYALDETVQITGSTFEDKEIDTVVRRVYRGEFGVSMVPEGSRELSTQLVRLDGVTESYFRETTYLGFPAGEQTRLRGKIQVPFSGPAIGTLTLKLRVLARANGNVPALTVTYRRIPAATQASPAALPTTDAAVTISTAKTGAIASTYYDVTATAFNVAAGDDVYFTIQRGVDAYAGEVGIVKIVGQLAAT